MSVIVLFILAGFNSTSFAQDEQTAGIPAVVHPARTETVTEIMQRAKKLPEVRMFERPEMEYPDRSNLPQNPLQSLLQAFRNVMQQS